MNIKIFSLSIFAAIMMTLFTYDCQAQDPIIRSQFMIQDARFNDMDITEQWVKDEAYLAWYDFASGDAPYFAVVKPNTNSQSYGKMFEMDSNIEAETATKYRTETYKFKWSYINDYDDKKGTSTVQIIITNKNVGRAFVCTIIPENLDVITFRGYVKGSLK